MKVANGPTVLTTISLAIVAVLMFTARVSGQGMDAHQHMNHMTPGATAEAVSMDMQEWAKARLAKSPRHQEWVKVKNGDREVSAFVVYPEVSKKAPAVVVIHEIFGMSDWVQSLTDQLAEAGYIAIAPDLLSGMGPGGGGTAEIRAADSNGVGKAIQALPPDQITADLNAIAAYVTGLPSANGKLAVGGFCWGGTQTFRYATNNPKLKAAFVFYGSAPANPDQTIDKVQLARIKARVYGFYAGNDMRINATLPKTIEAMKELKKKYEPVTYEGAGHGFMRAGESPPPEPPTVKGGPEEEAKAMEAHQKALTTYKANQKARAEAWVRWKKLLAGV
ncbi:MAG: carboxymethylenebutenolidase [Blastocatellia bacterium]|jgi:carboxymethylenebutenolidase|nr:carboxymethylenebutenolidase [Blastocatellia bacterium]